MFYNIGPVHLNNYPDHYQLGPFAISTDPGWHCQGDYVYKGYLDHGRLDRLLEQAHSLPGNYTVLYYDGDCLQIRTNRYRSYRLYYNNGSITNLDQAGTPIWVDTEVKLDSDFYLASATTKINEPVDNEPLTLAQARERIRNIINTSVAGFYNYNARPVNLFCSGGVDTLLTYAMLGGRQFKLIDHEYYKLDPFTTLNKTELAAYWGYQQIHYWDQPVVLATGSHGDEYMLRGPAVIAMLTSWYNINFGQLLANNPDCYHYKYFGQYQDLWQSSWDNRHELQAKYPTVQDLHEQVITMLLNDHQHWHLGETLTWTPFKNIELVKILLQCSIEELVPQFLDAKLTRDLIADYNPAVLEFLSKYKNYNPGQHLTELYGYHNCCI